MQAYLHNGKRGIHIRRKHLERWHSQSCGLSQEGRSHSQWHLCSQRSSLGHCLSQQDLRLHGSNFEIVCVFFTLARSLARSALTFAATVAVTARFALARFFAVARTVVIDVMTIARSKVFIIVRFFEKFVVIKKIVVVIKSIRATFITIIAAVSHKILRSIFVLHSMNFFLKCCDFCLTK